MYFYTFYKSGMYVALKPFTFIRALMSGNVQSWKVKFGGDEDSTNGPGVPTTPPKLKLLHLSTKTY